MACVLAFAPVAPLGFATQEESGWRETIRMRRFRIRVIPGDRVQVGLSPYDPTHGFITFRLREGEGS
jgi:hypothetical protein